MKFLLPVSACELRCGAQRHHGLQIEENRKGLKSLSAICSGLAESTEEQLLTPANHYHSDESFWGPKRGRRSR